MNERYQMHRLSPRAKEPRVRIEKVRQVRLLCVSALIAFWASLLVGRLYVLQVENGDRWRTQAKGQHQSLIEVASERGPIVDRHGRALAVSVPAGSVYLRPRQVRDESAVLRVLAEELSLSEQEGRALLAKQAPFVWVKRQLPRVTARRIAAQGIPGLGMVLESRRFYPYGGAASPILGMVGVDGRGLTGLEGRFDDYLSATDIQSAVYRDALGKQITADRDTLEIPRGAQMSLTLDADFQLILDEELAAVARERSAKGAFGVLIDGVSGEILAIGQAPTRNLNRADRVNASDLRSIAVETVFEPGSILKPFTAAGLLEAGVVSPEELLDCQDGRLRVGRHTIRDVKPLAVASFHDVVVRSSNIGMTLAAQRLGKRGMYQILQAFRLHETSGLSLPGESSGILRNPSTWAEVDIATHSFGQGVAVNALQLVRAFAVFTNQGRMPELQLLGNAEKAQPHQVLSAAVAQQVRSMLIDIVNAEHGTGKKAAVPGILIGGKTGTAQKANPNGGGYLSNAYITSFLGFADTRPMGLDKQYVLLVSVDEPQGEFRYGGVIAAPVFQRVITRIQSTMQTDAQRRGHHEQQRREPYNDLRLVSSDVVTTRG